MASSITGASTTRAAFLGEAGGGVSGSSSASTMVGPFFARLGREGESMGSDGGVLSDDDGGDDVTGGAGGAGGARLLDGAGVGGLGAGPFLGAPKKEASVVCLVLGMSDGRVERTVASEITDGSRPRVGLTWSARCSFS
jgi:hypothetical protein